MGERHAINGITALELTMREVMAGMEDLSCEFAFGASCADFEILSIEPPEDDRHLAPPPRPATTPRRPRPALVFAQSEREVA